MLARQHKLYTLSRGVFASHNSFHTVTPLSAHYFFNDFSPWLKRGGGGGRGGGEARKPPSGPSPISASRLCARAPALGAAAASARLPARPSCTPRGTGGGGGRAPQLCAAPSLAVGCCCLCRAQRLPCAVFFFLFVGGAGGLCLWFFLGCRPLRFGPRGGCAGWASPACAYIPDGACNDGAQRTLAPPVRTRCACGTLAAGEAPSCPCSRHPFFRWGHRSRFGICGNAFLAHFSRRLTLFALRPPLSPSPPRPSFPLCCSCLVSPFVLLCMGPCPISSLPLCLLT